MKYQTVGSESGSYGNLTMGRGRAGQFKRSRVHPLNPQSTAQTAVREVLSSIAARWRSLSEAAMQSWDNFAEAKGMVQKGFNAFTMVNALNVQGGNPVVLAPPTVASFGIFTSTGLTATLDTEAETVTLSVDGAANDVIPGGYIVEATKPTPPGRRNVNSAFRVLLGTATIANLGGATATIGAAYKTKFGLPTVGDRITVRVSQCTGGQRTPGAKFSAIVAEA